MPARESENYPPRSRLVHLGSGEVWMVLFAGGMPDDYESEGMVPLPDDYVIRLVEDSPRKDGIGVGALRRVHANYLHGAGWEVIERSLDAPHSNSNSNA